MDLRADGVGGVLTLFETGHGDDATCIHRVEGDVQLGRHAGIVAGGDESGIVVSDYGGGARGQTVEHIIGIGAPAAEIERVSDAERSQAPGGFGHAFENEAMEAVARVWIGASESFVEQHRQMELIGDIDGEIEGRVGIRPPVHLTPVEDIFAAGADGGRVEGPRALVHLYRNSRRPERPPQAGSLPHGYNERTDASLEPGKTVVGLSGAAYEAGGAAGGVHRGDHRDRKSVV